jgi:cell division protein ZapA
MAQVNVTISGKAYRMACDDGQEAHLTALGERLNQTIDMLRERFGEIGDQRLTVMAAITMADQYSETERRLRQVEAEIAGLEEARAAVVERQEQLEANVAGAIEALAERVEGIAHRLNGVGTNGGGGP